MRKSFKYRIYPTKSQRSRMERTLDLCRWVYNQTLAYWKDAWEIEGRSTSKYETHNLLPGWKVEKPELIEVHSQVLQNVQERVELAFKAFFRRVRSGEKPGYPRFKGKGWYDSFAFPQSGFKLVSGKLRLSKIGDVMIKLHRPIEGKIKRLTIREPRPENGLPASQWRSTIRLSLPGKTGRWWALTWGWRVSPLCPTVRRSITLGSSDLRRRRWPKLTDGYPSARRELLRGGKPLRSSNGFMSGSLTGDTILLIR